MSQGFQSGDFLIFQLESGYGLLRILTINGTGADAIWHLAAYGDLFLDVEMAEAALELPERLSVSEPHIALTNRAFESTQVAKITTLELTGKEIEPVIAWENNPNREVSDRSVRLMLGLR